MLPSDNRNETPTDRECGVLYIATGEKYVDEVFQSVETLKREADLHCTLISDTEYDHDLVDNVIVRKNPEHRPDNSYKVYNIKESPYERTLYLDSDTHVRTDVSELFGVLDRFDLAVTHAPVRNTDRVADIPVWFPEYNCGVMVFKTTETRRFFDRWRENYAAMGNVQDQPAFRKTLFESDDIDFFTLLREYNVRFWPGFVDEEVRVVHTHLDNEVISRVFQSTEGPRAYYFRNNEIVIKSNHESLFKRARDSVQEDGLVSTVQKGIRRIGSAF